MPGQSEPTSTTASAPAAKRRWKATAIRCPRSPLTCRSVVTPGGGDHRSSGGSTSSSVTAAPVPRKASVSAPATTGRPSRRPRAPSSLASARLHLPCHRHPSEDDHLCSRSALPIPARQPSPATPRDGRVPETSACTTGRGSGWRATSCPSSAPRGAPCKPAPSQARPDQRHVLHQRQHGHPAHRLEHLPPEEQSLITVGEPQTSSPQVQQPPPEAITALRLRPGWWIGVKSKAAEGHGWICQRRSNRGQPPSREATIGVQEKQGVGAGSSSPEGQLRPAAPCSRDHRHPREPFLDQRHRAIAAAAVGQHDLDRRVLAHRLQAR